MQEENEQKEEVKEEGGVFKKLWNKTVFSDMQKEKNERREMERGLRKEALAEAQDELKDIYKKQIIQKEKDRIQGKSKGKDMLKKLGDEFADMGKNVGNKDVGSMMGFGGGSSNQQQNSGEVLNNDKIGSMMSLGGNKEQSNRNDNSGGIASDEKIKKMLGR